MSRTAAAAPFYPTVMLQSRSVRTIDAEHKQSFTPSLVSLFYFSSLTHVLPILSLARVHQVLSSSASLKGLHPPHLSCRSEGSVTKVVRSPSPDQLTFYGSSFYEEMCEKK